MGVLAGWWGYPLAHGLEAFPKALAVHGIGLNSLHKFDRLKTANDRFVVTPNNLTIDAYGILDVTRGPVVVGTCPALPGAPVVHLWLIPIEGVGDGAGASGLIGASLPG